jgi:hypothetical protein
MFKAIAIASLLFLTQSLRLETHDPVVYDKNGNMAY